jgi:hypothetical protein
MYVLVFRSETALNISGFLLTVEYGYSPKVPGTLRQRYAECRAASKVFNRPYPKMAL